mmetsp:Transcript_662/g.1033  ORF Transcript_662/g.1033 Transcript_662/m.1033 type:complete len:80 (+) Transcript_662:339-578(+)
MLIQERMNAAFRIISRLQNQNISTETNAPCSGSSPLIAIHHAKYYRDSDYQLSLGPGPFVTALESATGVQAHVVGKPPS